MFSLRFKDVFSAIEGMNVGPAYSAAHIAMNILVTLFCGLVVYAVYKKTYSGVLFSKHMGGTLIIVSVVTSLIVMVISGNLALSLGMVGALSIVRFRTPVKDPRDLSFLFWSVTNGVICGVSAYKMAFFSVVFVSLCMVFLSKRITWTSPYLLVLKMTGGDEKAIQHVLTANCARFKERSATLTKKESEVVYELRLKDVPTSQFLKKIKAVEGVDQAVMVSYEGELDEAR